jgi:hypothetical protein
MPTSTNKSEGSWQAKAGVGDLHLGAHPGFLHRPVRHALLGGGALRAPLGSGTTPQAWYCPATSTKVILAVCKHSSTAQWDLSIFSYSFLAGTSA